MGLSVSWGQLQRFSVVGQRKLVTPLVVVGKREKVMKLCVCRVELQCIVQFFDGPLSGAYGEILQRTRIVFSRGGSGGAVPVGSNTARKKDDETK
jgi:hypothetical protein